MISLKELYTITMDVHQKFRTDSHQVIITITCYLKFDNLEYQTII